jgi:regulator of sirC expression with transglutaminase-like and TPR domain
MYLRQRALLNRGLLYYQQGHQAAAIADYTAALALDLKPAMRASGGTNSRRRSPI